MPAPVYYSHKILERLAEARKHEGEASLALTVNPRSLCVIIDGQPVERLAIVLSTQHLDASLDSRCVGACKALYPRSHARRLDYG